MRILISHTGLFKKAGWGRIFPLAEGLAGSGNHVTILTTNQRFSLFTRKLVLNNVRVYIYPEIVPSRVAKMGFGLLSLFLKIMHVAINNYDIVHSDNGHRPLAGVPCRIHKKLHGSVYVAEWYDWYGRGGQYDNKKKLFKLILGRYELRYELKDKRIADGIVVVSEVLRERAEKLKSSDRIIKIHGGADVSAIPYLKDNTELKARYGISSDVLTFGYINSDSYRLAEFLPIINTLSEYNLFPRVKILVFGKYDLIISRLDPGIADQITFFGWIDFARDFEKLQLVDVFFLFKEEMLGNRAGWPNCIGDYLACGRPVLLNPVGEVVEFAGKYPFAFIKSSLEPDEIYSNIKYLSENREQLKVRGDEIRKLAMEEVSWEKKSRQLMDFYVYLKTEKDSRETPSDTEN